MRFGSSAVRGVLMTLALGVVGSCPAFVAVLLSCNTNLDRLEPVAIVVGLVAGIVTILGVLVRLWTRYS